MRDGGRKLRQGQGKRKRDREKVRILRAADLAYLVERANGMVSGVHTRAAESLSGTLRSGYHHFERVTTHPRDDR